MIEPLLGVDLSREGDRFQAREVISAVLAPWFAERSLEEIRRAFAGTAVCWGPYQTFRQMAEEDPLLDSKPSVCRAGTTRNRPLSRSQFAAPVFGRGAAGAAASPDFGRAHRRGVERGPGPLRRGNRPAPRRPCRRRTD